MEKRKIEVCFTSENIDYFHIRQSHVVVVDILRATSSICAAFANGVKTIIPVATLGEAKKAKQRGLIVAAERNGQKRDFADFGNSPFNFTPERVAGKDVAYSTTNGTRAIVSASGGLSVSIGSFINISAVAKWLVAKQEGDVLVLCAGRKGKFCLEDSIFAGALVELLLKDKSFYTECDSAQAAIQLWNVAKVDLPSYLELISQRHRLKRLGLDDVLQYCFTPNLTDVVPILVNGKLRNANVINE
ncbi:MAG: 2-phosphosulfolactate phosphatase [Bacteroidales bacterium]|nr:2-phosphosulfolactate phosphatase [Bacteroidales bacterium]MDD4672549.1 2-phosphosulfolactate phosphatase [Bacteroidales bacterium]MDY0348127.1 2-phosphosulfolactate phosphatase [Tenuifilaceae bacterium]